MIIEFPDGGSTVEFEPSDGWFTADVDGYASGKCLTREEAIDLRNALESYIGLMTGDAIASLFKKEGP